MKCYSSIASRSCRSCSPGDMDYRVVLRLEASGIAFAINCFQATAQTPPGLATAATSFSPTSSTMEAPTQQDSRTRVSLAFGILFGDDSPTPTPMWPWMRALHVTACVIVKPQQSCSLFAHTCTSVQLLGTANTFRGFLIQARDGGENYIGSFTDLPALTQTLGCDTSNPAVR